MTLKTTTFATLMAGVMLAGLAAQAPLLAQSPAQSPAPAPEPAAPPAASGAPEAPTAPDAPVRSETPPSDQFAPEALDLPARPALTIVGSSNWDDAEKSLSEAVNALYAAIAKAKLETAGPPMVEYLENGDEDFRFQAFVPVKQLPVKPFAQKDIKGGETPSGKVLKFTHTGSFEDLEDVYNRIDDYLASKNLQMLRVVEEYQSDPTSTPADQMVTNIYVFTE